jgi:O-antigen/teichoic acid export membrane protein
MVRALASIRRIVPLSGGVAATAQTVMVNALILALNFGTGIITARLLGPDGRGAQAAMQMWPWIMAYALTLGLPTALLYNFRRYPESGPQLFSAGLLMSIGLGLLATLAGIAFIPYWLTEYSPETVRSAQWFMVFSMPILVIAAFSSVLRARQEFTAFNVVRCLIPMLTLLILALLALLHRLTPFTATLAFMLPHVPVLLWLTVRLWRAYRPTLRGLRTPFRSLTSYGVRFYGADILGQMAAGQIDRVLVVGLLDPAAMGLYVVASSLSRMLNIFPIALAQVVFPKVVSRPVEEVVALIGRGVRVSTTVAILAGALLAILGPWALRLVYGQEFLPAIPVFRLLLVEVILSGATWVLAQAFMASDKPGITSIMQGIGFSLNIPLLAVLVPRYELVGAGLAVLISTTVRFVFALVNYPITLRVHPPSLRPRWSDFTSIIRRGGDDGRAED